MITAMSIYIMSSGNLFLIQQEQTKDREILLLRTLYEDVRNYRRYGELPTRPVEWERGTTVIDTQSQRIRKVSINDGNEVIAIERKK